MVAAAVLGRGPAADCAGVWRAEMAGRGRMLASTGHLNPAAGAHHELVRHRWCDRVQHQNAAICRGRGTVACIRCERWLAATTGPLQGAHTTPMQRRRAALLHRFGTCASCRVRPHTSPVAHNSDRSKPKAAIALLTTEGLCR